MTDLVPIIEARDVAVLDHRVVLIGIDAIRVLGVIADDGGVLAVQRDIGCCDAEAGGSTDGSIGSHVVDGVGS